MQVDDLILTKSLGKGAFGEVFLTQKKGYNLPLATKRLDRAFSEKPENVKRLANEINLLKKLNHPNIVKLIDLKKTKSHCYIVMEFCNGGDLTSCLKKYKAIHRRPFSEEIVQYIMRHVVKGLHYLHSNKVIHRDLKLDNILVNFPSENDKNSLNMMRCIPKIIDFGFATMLKQSKANLAFTVLGTPTNMDPQILQNMETKTLNQQGYDEKADIWSLGTLCYEMLVGHMAFSASSMQELYQKVKQGTYSLPTNLSEEVVSFINSMLKQNPKERLSTGDLLKHSFLVKNVKQFKPLDVRKLPGTVIGGMVNMNTGKENKKADLHQTVWDIFANPIIPAQQNAQVVYAQPQIQPQIQMGGQQVYSIPQMQYPQQQYQYAVPGVASNMQYQYQYQGY